MTAVERYQERQLPERLSVEQIQYISKTELIPKQYRGNVPAMMACILTGRALGLDDMHSFRAINVIDGKATVSAELMVTLSRQRGHSITADLQPGTVTVKGKRADNGDEMSVTWTMEMAARAGLANKQNWKQYPEAMLWARAVSQLCRMLFPDVLLGLAYTQDEMGGVVVEVPGEALDDDTVEGEPMEVDDTVIDEALADSEGEDPGEEQGVVPSEESLFQPPDPEVTERRRKNRETAE